MRSFKERAERLAEHAGLPEVLIFLLILLVIFGGSRIPELGRALGTGFRELREHVGRGWRSEEKIDAGEEPSRHSSEELVDCEEVRKGALSPLRYRATDRGRLSPAR